MTFDIDFGRVMENDTISSFTSKSPETSRVRTRQRNAILLTCTTSSKHIGLMNFDCIQ